MSRDEGWITLTLVVGVAGAQAIAHRKTPYDEIFEREGRPREVDPDLLRALAQVESSMNPNAVSPLNQNGTRDYGLMQLNERTAAGMGLDKSQLFDPAVNVAAGARLLYSNRLELGPKFSPYTWISSYNQGVGGVKQRGIVNLDYVAKVSYHWQMFALGRSVFA